MKQINEVNKCIKKDIIVENLMISNGVYLLVSHPKVGKSMFAQQLAFSLTTGEDFLGFKVNPSHVLYITTEGDINQLQERFKLMNLKPNVDKLHIIDIDDIPDFYIRDIERDIHELTFDKEPLFVIIDMFKDIKFDSDYNQNDYQEINNVVFKKFKENNHKIQFLIVFNAISWIIMIYSYLFMDGFFYNSSELKYFIFNIILNIILGIYCIFKFYAIKPVTKVIFECLLIFYVIANIYQTSVIVVEHDQKALDRRYELVNVLKENNLTFGYADFWDGLMTYYLSNYKITTVSVITDDRVSSYRWYSDKRWYDSGYHTGKTFLALNSNGKLFKDFYKMYYGNPDKIVETDNYTVFIYNKNPFDNEFEKEND